MSTFVKATLLESTSGTSCSGLVSGTAGNLWTCGSAAFSATVSPTITGGGTWTKDVTDATGSPNSISSTPNIAGGSATVTSTATGGNGVTASVSEFSGPPTSSVVDHAAPAVDFSSGTSASTNPLTNTGASAIFFAVIADDNGSNGTLTGTGSGWTSSYISGTEQMFEKNGNSFQVLGTAYKIVSSIAAQTMTWTVTSSNWRANIISYKGSVLATGVLGVPGVSNQLPQASGGVQDQVAAGWI